MADSDTINTQINMKCPYCNNKATKYSKVPTVKSGKKQRYRCTECGKTFYAENSKEKHK